MVCAKIFHVILLMTERIRNISNQIAFFIVSNWAKLARDKLARDSANKSCKLKLCSELTFQSDSQSFEVTLQLLTMDWKTR